MAGSSLRAALVCHCKRFEEAWAHTLIRLQSLIGMLSPAPSTPPASQTTSTSSNLTSSQSTNSTYITASSASSVKEKVVTWLYLATALLLLTVVLPFIAGPTDRFISRHWTLSLGLLLILSPYFYFLWRELSECHLSCRGDVPDI